MSERYYVNVSSLAGLSPGDYVVHPVIGGFKVARDWQPSYDREVKAAAWDEGAKAAWERSTSEVNASRYHWRSSGEPRNPYESEARP